MFSNRKMKYEKNSQKIFSLFNLVMALLPVALMILIVAFLVYYSIPSIRYNGFSFLTAPIWNPGNFNMPPVVVNGVEAPLHASFGMLIFFAGTIATSVIAIIIAFVFSIFISINLTLYAPSRLKSILSTMIEVFAGIPSVVYGLWGIVVLEPIMFNTIDPGIARVFGFLPGFSGAIYTGAGVLTAGFILSIMVIPIVTSVIYDSMRTTSSDQVEGALALGSTKWETARRILIGGNRKQILGGTLLGLGRALGETMAVLMVIGAVDKLPTNIFSPTSTMAAAIAAKLDNAFLDGTGMNLSALAELGLALLLISLAVNLIARRIVGRGILRGYEGE